MFLADKASDDGSGIWCSKGTIQRHTELGETTVKRTVRDFLKEGILVETGARGCKNGFTVVYRIDLARVETLEMTAEPEIETGATVDPVQTGPGAGATVAGVPGPPRPPNHPKTIHKPPTRKREAVEDEEAARILGCYPPDRLRGEAECLARIRESLDEGTEAEDLLQAVKTYAAVSAGFTRSKVCFSDNWFRREKWLSHVRADRERAKHEERALATVVANAVDWVKDNSPLCKHVSSSIALAAIEAGLLTRQQVVAAGIQL